MDCDTCEKPVQGNSCLFMGCEKQSGSYQEIDNHMIDTEIMLGKLSDDKFIQLHNRHIRSFYSDIPCCLWKLLA